MITPIVDFELRGPFIKAYQYNPDKCLPDWLHQREIGVSTTAEGQLEILNGNGDYEPVGLDDWIVAVNDGHGTEFWVFADEIFRSLFQPMFNHQKEGWRRNDGLVLGRYT